MTKKQQFPEILRNLRGDQGWSQSYLATKLDISVGTYSAYERGISEPSLAILIQLSDIFNVSIDYLAQGREFELPLTNEETTYRQLERMTLRLENTIQRQTRLLRHIGKKLENDLATMVKGYSEDFVDIYSRSAGKVLLEEEIWTIEQHAWITRVAYPYLDDNLKYDKQTGEYTEGDYFHNQVCNLRENPEHKYVEVYAKNVTNPEFEIYKKLIKQRCGNAAYKRVELWQCNQPVITQYVVYDLKISRLREKHPSLFEMMANSIVDDRYIAFLVTPQLDYPYVNFLADKEHCGYIMNHFNYLLTQSVRV